MEKDVLHHNKFQRWAYVFETKTSYDAKIRTKAREQLERAKDKFRGCINCDRVLLYYVSGPNLNVECLGVYDRR